MSVTTEPLPVTSGGEGGPQVVNTVAGSLNLAVPEDRRFFAEAIRQGWQLNPELKALGFKCVRKVLEVEQAKPKPNSRVLRHCMMIIAHEQDAALADLHHLERLEGFKTAARIRAENGRPVQVGVAVQVNGAEVKVEPTAPSAGIDYDAFRRQFLADGATQ